MQKNCQVEQNPVWNLKYLNSEELIGMRFKPDVILAEDAKAERYIERSNYPDGSLLWEKLFPIQYSFGKKYTQQLFKKCFLMWNAVPVLGLLSESNVPKPPTGATWQVIYLDPAAEILSIKEASIESLYGTVVAVEH